MNKRKYGSHHPVVAINPDGSVAGYFEYVKGAASKCGITRHSITYSCRKGTICKGFRWYYEEDFRKIYEEQRMDELKFCKKERVVKKFQEWSKEKQESRRKISRETSLRLVNDPNSNFGPNRKAPPAISKKVICLDSGEVYQSVAECSRKTGLGLSALYVSLRRFTKCGGKKFMLYSVYKEVNKRLNSHSV